MGFREISKLGCIHGRFQPFHYGHVNYFLEAVKIWPKLIIGLAAPTPVKNPIAGVEHRATDFANPLTYTERMILIRSSLSEIGVNSNNVEFIPFPIDEPEKLEYILPKTIVCATTRLYQWNEEKIRRLEKYGYKPHVLEQCVKSPFDGSTIREYIINDDPIWKTYMPEIAAELIEEWKIRDRLISMINKQ
ncbi:adenylyltransferase/cytidyltransferase family protein [Methylomonas sp. WH-1]|uniref:adenylyltransferase/cytidyltransferase family protein n=1 Tax=unclassified Methylomonas TaxID=2608980 RepID=UPI00051B2C00|nr:MULTISPECIES: adenylyltransferase/cytidyltransferase family protein [unclassified Methylomonas]